MKKKLTKKDDVQINIMEIRRPELDAMIVGETIARQIESRSKTFHSTAIQHESLSGDNLGQKP